MSLNSNYLVAPLIGNNGSYADGIDPIEILNFLFKKSFNIANTRLYGTYNADTPSFAASVNLNIKNIYSQFIPLSNNILYPLILQTSWLNLKGGTTNSSSGVKYISSNYPYISYYSNVLMTAAVASSSNAFFCGNANTPYETNFSTNVIPYYYGNGQSYNHILYSCNATTVLDFGNGAGGGSWLLDTDTGVLTFYDSPTSAVVNSTNPPRITFWRYEGLIGNSGIVNVGNY